VAQSTPAHSALSWAIVGQGAIGLLAASRLQRSGTKVALWLRQPTRLVQNVAGSTLTFCPATAPLNAVLVPVKSYAVLDAISSLLPALSADAQLVLSHNGMGTIEQVVPLLQPGQGLWFLTTTHGALKQADTVVHTGQGQSVLAALNPAALTQQKAVQQAMEIALGPVTLVDDITPFLWQKLALNAVINPLTALHNCRNGALAQQSFQPRLQAILLEVCQVAQASGIALDFTQTCTRLQQVIKSTAENYSSMQQDIQHQRRTEIAAINGFVVQQAARLNIAVPHNAVLLQQVSQLEHAASR
jgi:2-dehydropantoate 2-reductase